MELIGLPCSRFMGMAASPACAPGLIFRPTFPPRHVVFRCYWAPKLSSRRRRRRHTPAAAAASARASPATARGLDADDFCHPLDKQASLVPVANKLCSFCPHILSSEKIRSFFLVLQNTLLLRAVPGLNDVGKALLGHPLTLFLCHTNPT
jgi:hypothetical protein